MNLSKHITAKCTLPISLPPIISHQPAENGWVPNQDEDVSFGTRNWSHDMLWSSKRKGHSEGKCRYLYIVHWLWEGDIDMIFISISKLRIVPRIIQIEILCTCLMILSFSSWSLVKSDIQPNICHRKEGPPDGPCNDTPTWRCSNHWWPFFMLDIFLKVWSFENWECFIFFEFFLGGKNGVPGFAKRWIVWALLNG